MVNGMDNLGPSQAFDFYKSGAASGQRGIFTPFLGPAPREQQMNAWEKRSHAKWNMPDAYVGINKPLRDTFEDYMFTAQFDWYTERIMPWYKTDDIHMQWTEWENNPHYLGVTPHQSASRLVTQKRTIRRASIIRRGIAFEFEHDFVATALGRTSFMASFAQMARSVQETANVEVIRALLNCHRMQQAYIRHYGIVKDFELDQYHERRENRFMCAQKDDFGLEKLSTEIEGEQETYGGKADVWILDRAIMDYTDLVPENRTLYYKGGQEAVDRINGRPNGITAAGGTQGNLKRLDPPRMVGQTPTFIAKSFHVEGLGKADLMSRVTEIGVYNTMIDRCTDYFDYKSVSRRIRVYDEDIDGWSDLDFEYALRRCVIWDTKTGNLKEAYNRAGRGGGGNRSHRDAQDQDHDFLRYKDANGVPKDIEYMGDISLMYQSEHDLIDCAKSLLAAACYHDKELIRKTMEEFLVKTAPTENSQGTRGFNSTVRTAIQSLVGKDNLFKDTLSEDQAFYYNFYDLKSALAFPVSATSSMGASVSSSSGSESIDQMERKFLSVVIGQALPGTYQARVNDIASDTSKSFKARSQELKNLVVEVIEANPGSVQNLDNASDVDAWFNLNMSGFEKKRQARAAELESLTAQAQTSESQGRYFPVDAPLPRGWRWADPNANKKSVIDRMPMFQQQQEQVRSSATAAGRGGRARIGGRAGAVRGGRTDEEYKEQLRQDAEARQLPENLPGRSWSNVKVSGGMRNVVDKIADSGAHPLLKALAIIYAGIKFNRDVLCNLIKNNVAVKIGLLLMRPHCTYRTKFGIKCLSGGGSGYTFIGHSNMQIEHEAARKVGMAHYTTYLSAVVLYPKNVYVVEDLYCERYLGGMGVEFWTADKYAARSMRRNAYDIICAPLPPSRKRLEQRIDVRGRWYTEMRRQLVSEERFQRPLYESCGRINQLLKWHDASGRDRTVSRTRVAPNYVCSQGMQFHYNAKLGRFDDYIVESGCMGPNVGPGVGLVRNGKLKAIPKFNYHAVH